MLGLASMGKTLLRKDDLTEMPKSALTLPSATMGVSEHGEQHDLRREQEAGDSEAASSTAASGRKKADPTENEAASEAD